MPGPLPAGPRYGCGKAAVLLFLLVVLAAVLVLR